MEVVVGGDVSVAGCLLMNAMNAVSESYVSDVSLRERNSIVAESFSLPAVSAGRGKS